MEGAAASFEYHHACLFRQMWYSCTIMKGSRTARYVAKNRTGNTPLTMPSEEKK